MLHEEGVWQELLRNKYLGAKTLAHVEARPTDSPFWKGLMRVKDEFFNRGFFKIGDGALTRFWEDTWLGDTPLKSQYPSLYNIVQRKNVYVSNVLSRSPLNITFKRALIGDKWDAWSHLCHRLMEVQLSDTPDSFVWKLMNNGKFTVKSMYEDLMNGHTRFLSKYL